MNEEKKEHIVKNPKCIVGNVFGTFCLTTLDNLENLSKLDYKSMNFFEFLNWNRNNKVNKGWGISEDLISKVHLFLFLFDCEPTDVVVMVPQLTKPVIFILPFERKIAMLVAPIILVDDKEEN